MELGVIKAEVVLSCCSMHLVERAAVGLALKEGFLFCTYRSSGRCTGAVLGSGGTDGTCCDS